MKSIYAAALAILSTVLLTSVGCIELDIDLSLPFFTHPTVKPEKAVLHSELIGSYRVLSDDDVSNANSFVHIGRAGKKFPSGFLRTIFVDVSYKERLQLDDSNYVFVHQIGEHYVLHYPVLKRVDEDGNDQFELGDDRLDTITPVKGWKSSDYAGYVLLMLKPVEGGFDIAMMNTDFLKAEISAGRLKGQTSNKSTTAEANSFGLVVKENGEELIEFIENNLDKLYGETELKLRKLN